MENQFGAYRDFHVVRIVTISPTTQMIYIQLDYPNGPAFGKFLVYQARESWNIVSFKFGADPEVVYGLSLFGAPDIAVTAPTGFSDRITRALGPI